MRGVSWRHDEACSTAPQGNVTQTSHKHVTEQDPTSPKVTNTLNCGVAG
jgi:hypothetical protein